MQRTTSAIVAHSGEDAVRLPALNLKCKILFTFDCRGKFFSVFRRLSHDIISLQYPDLDSRAFVKRRTYDFGWSLAPSRGLLLGTSEHRLINEIRMERRNYCFNIERRPHRYKDESPRSPDNISTKEPGWRVQWNEVHQTTSFVLELMDPGLLYVHRRTAPGQKHQLI